MDPSTDKPTLMAAANPVKVEGSQPVAAAPITSNTPIQPAAPTAMPTQAPAPVSNPSAPAAPPSAPGGPNQPHHPVAEFLYQLTKMLTDDNNEIIEWVDGRIKVHFPERLETEVLHKYFRHSKFASFQRQLNYFGFRKIAGKGKMSPCSYVNESATSDIRSLLLIKRKTNGSAARKAMAQRALNLSGGMNPALGIGLPGLAGAPGFGVLGAFPTVGQQFQMGLNGASNNMLSQLLIQNQQPAAPTVEQLQAQIAALTKQQSQGALNPAFNAAALGLAPGAALTQLENPATAALNAASAGPASAAMPATAAMNGASAGQSTNLFESATNLKALIGNDLVGAEQQKTLAPASALNNLIPNGASMGNLLASSNRLSSLLSLNSFLSREPSLADFAIIPNGAAQFAALQQQATVGAPTTAMPYDASQVQNANMPS